MGEFLSGMVAPAEATGPVESIAWKIGVEVAAPVADDVDRESRFPREAVEEFKRSGLLSALVPEHLGGGGATLAEIAGAVRALAFHCTSSALVLAMHSIEVSNLARHGNSEPLQALLREIASEQLLIANANSEVGIGGDVGRSICAVDTTDGRLRLEKQALAISYGEYADAIVATARRSPDSEQTDQVQVICRKPDFTLEQTSTWDAIGLRGTCSNGFRLLANVDERMIYPVPFAVDRHQRRHPGVDDPAQRRLGRARRGGRRQGARVRARRRAPQHRHGAARRRAPRRARHRAAAGAQPARGRRQAVHRARRLRGDGKPRLHRLRAQRQGLYLRAGGPHRDRRA